MLHYLDTNLNYFHAFNDTLEFQDLQVQNLQPHPQGISIRLGSVALTIPLSALPTDPTPLQLSLTERYPRGHLRILAATIHHGNYNFYTLYIESYDTGPISRLITFTDPSTPRRCTQAVLKKWLEGPTMNHLLQAHTREKLLEALTFKPCF